MTRYIYPSRVCFNVRVTYMFRFIREVAACSELSFFILRKFTIFVARRVACVRVSMITTFFRCGFYASRVNRYRSIKGIVCRFFSFVVVVERIRINAPTRIIDRLLMPSSVRFGTFIFCVANICVAISRT